MVQHFETLCNLCNTRHGMHAGGSLHREHCARDLHPKAMAAAVVLHRPNDVL